jgi:hypothetical protein
MKYVPNMLNAGNKIGTIKNTLSEVLKLKSGKEKAISLFVLYARIANTINTILNEIKRGIVDSGDL